MMKAGLFYKICLFIGAVFYFQSCNTNPFQHGEILYQNFCANCHMDDGSGLEGFIPPLANADFMRDRKDEVPCIIRFGMDTEIIVNQRKYQQPMAGVPQLTDTEITNVINYINHSFGNAPPHLPSVVVGFIPSASQCVIGHGVNCLCTHLVTVMHLPLDMCN